MTPNFPLSFPTCVSGGIIPAGFQLMELCNQRTGEKGTLLVPYFYIFLILVSALLPFLAFCLVFVPEFSAIGEGYVIHCPQS